MSARIAALGKRYHMRTIGDTDIVHDLKIVEDALYRWHIEYPKDPDPAKTAFALEQLYQAVQSTNARTHATTLLRYIAKIAPKSNEAHFARLRLAQGFPTLQNETPVAPTPDPYASPTGAPTPEASGPSAASPTDASPSPDSSASPQATNSTQPTTPSPPATPAAPSPSASPSHNANL